MIKTRTEKINDVTYCTYCGKVLRDESNAICVIHGLNHL